ncbi:hypothetical protein DFJ73DRAFT_769493 [Zopfochytrium polystomum]|nr:hypothetical protein DFJ73DRAFT_769493 [Zopfochytrium polystomum]
MPAQPHLRRRVRPAPAAVHVLVAILAALMAAAAFAASSAHAITTGNEKCQPAIDAFRTKVNGACGAPSSPDPSPEAVKKAWVCQCSSPDLIPCSQAINDNCVHTDGFPVTVLEAMDPVIRTTEQLKSLCARWNVTITGTLSAPTASITVVTPTTTAFSSTGSSSGTSAASTSNTTVATTTPLLTSSASSVGYTSHALVAAVLFAFVTLSSLSV